MYGGGSSGRRNFGGICKKVPRDLEMRGWGSRYLTVKIRYGGWVGVVNGKKTNSP